MAHPKVRTLVSAIVSAILAGGASAAATRAAAEPSAAPHPPVPVKPLPLKTYAGLAAPESVLYDAAGDRYLVSNVNGRPLEADGNGFISVLSPEGKVVELKWIAGGKNGAKLNAPKGLAIAGGLLYVADLTVIHLFDARTGAPRGELAVPGATSLSGVVAAPDGKVYVTDAGPPTGRLDGVGTEAIYVIQAGRIRRLAEGNELGRPHALAWTARGPVVASFGSGEVYRLDGRGGRRQVTRLPAGGLAGVVAAGDSLLVASWQSSSVYRGRLGGKFDVAFAGQASPADLGYDAKRGRLLVPHFEEGTVDVFELR